MHISMARFLLSISFLFLSWLTMPALAQKSKYAATIEMNKGYVSGICFLSEEGDTIKGSIFNEFGISVLDFTYLRSKHQVKLENVIKMLNKWYIRRLLKSDLRKVIHNLQQGEGEYRNEKYKIDYKFSELKDETEE